MRILFNAAFDTRAHAGISLYIRRLVPELARLCDLSILTPDPEIFAPYGRTIRIPGGVRFPVRRTLFTLTQLHTLCRGNAEVLLCATPAIPVPPPLPTIAVIHDLCPLSIPQLNPIKLKASFFAGLQTLRLADHVVTDSQYTRDDLTAMNLLPRWRTSVAFCGPGVLPSDKEPNYARRFVPFVLYVGSHAPHKNVARLIHAFARVRASRKLKLVLVGPGSKEQLHRMARIVGLNNLHSRVVHLPTMSDPQMSSLYRHCQLLACPSLYEGFGLPVLEAMLHGAPVACSNASSLPEVAGQAAILFNPFSTTDIANQLQTVLDSPGLASQLSEAGRDRALLFNWERTASSILARAAELT